MNCKKKITIKSRRWTLLLVEEWSLWWSKSRVYGDWNCEFMEIEILILFVYHTCKIPWLQVRTVRRTPTSVPATRATTGSVLTRWISMCVSVTYPTEGATATWRWTRATPTCAEMVPSAWPPPTTRTSTASVPSDTPVSRRLQYLYHLKSELL